MRFRIAKAFGVLLSSAILLSGCGAGYKIGSAKLPDWPETPGTPPEETRAKRQAEAQPYLAVRTLPKNEPKQRPPVEAAAPSSAAPERPSRKVETAALTPSDAPAASRYGDLLFISGQVAVDAPGNALSVDARVEEQARLALENVRSILEANRLSMANIVSMTVYLTDLNDLRAFDAVAPSFFKSGLPSRSVVEVSRLRHNAKVEVSAVAGR